MRMTLGAKVLKIGAHVWAALPTCSVGIVVFGCQRAMRVRTLIPAFSQRAKEEPGEAEKDEKSRSSYI